MSSVFDILKNKIILLLCNKKIDLDRMTIPTVEIGKEDVFYFPLSSNSIKILKIQGQSFFFRPCRKNKGLNEHIDNAINSFLEMVGGKILLENFLQKIDFCIQLSEQEVHVLADYLNQRKSERDFYLKIKNIKHELEAIHFSLWNNPDSVSNVTLAHLGLDNFPHSVQKIQPIFLTYMANEISHYSNYSANSHKYDTFGASRSIASFIVAKHLNVAHIYAEARLIKLNIAGNEEFGVLSPKVAGTRSMDTEINVSPELHAELTNLNIVDAICFQKDHNTNNYNIDPNQSENIVCAFDNDNPTTFFCSPFLPSTMSGGVSPVVMNGKINRPHTTEELAQSISNLNIEKLKEEISPYLTCSQWWALKKRISQLQKAIDKTAKSNTQFLVARTSWNTDALDQELSGKYGTTYLCLIKSPISQNKEFH